MRYTSTAIPSSQNESSPEKAALQPVAAIKAPLTTAGVTRLDSDLSAKAEEAMAAAESATRQLQEARSQADIAAMRLAAASVQKLSADARLLEIINEARGLGAAKLVRQEDGGLAVVEVNQ